MDSLIGEVGNLLAKGLAKEGPWCLVIWSNEGLITLNNLDRDGPDIAGFLTDAAAAIRRQGVPQETTWHTVPRSH